MRGDELKPWQMKVTENLRLNWAVELKARKKKQKTKKSIFPAVNNTARACDTTSLKAFITPMTQRSTGVNVKEHALFNGVERLFLFCG